jgi:hypothetical protein
MATKAKEVNFYYSKKFVMLSLLKNLILIALCVLTLFTKSGWICIVALLLMLFFSRVLIKDVFPALFFNGPILILNETSILCKQNNCKYEFKNCEVFKYREGKYQPFYPNLCIRKRNHNDEFHVYILFLDNYKTFMKEVGEKVEIQDHGRTSLVR